MIFMPLISGFQCNCCGLIFDFPAYVGNDEMCPACHCEEFTTIYQKEEYSKPNDKIDLYKIL